MCEWVAPANYPNALSDPRFDTGMMEDRRTGEFAVLHPRYPEKRFYPITLAETGQGVDTAYFNQVNFRKIQREVENNPESVQVFYLGDGESVRMGNCDGDFGVSATHGQRDVAFAYPIRYHRTLTPDRLRFLIGQQSVEDPDPESLEGLQQQIDQISTQKLAAMRQGDRPSIVRLSQDIQLLKRKIAKVQLGTTPSPEQLERFNRQTQEEFQQLQRTIEARETDEARREQLLHSLRDRWSSVLP